MGNGGDEEDDDLASTENLPWIVPGSRIMGRVKERYGIGEKNEGRGEGGNGNTCALSEIMRQYA